MLDDNILRLTKIRKEIAANSDGAETRKASPKRGLSMGKGVVPNISNPRVLRVGLTLLDLGLPSCLYHII
jgi:hypothetical protein